MDDGTRLESSHYNSRFGERAVRSSVFPPATVGGRHAAPRGVRLLLLYRCANSIALRPTYNRLVLVLVLVALCVLVPGSRALRAEVQGTAAPTQTEFTVKELAEYQLTTSVFGRFEKASRAIAAIIRSDAAFANSPLFTRDVLVLGDAAIIANELATRLHDHPRLAAALREARMTAREYAKFAVSLFAARLAHGFVAAGVLRKVPPGVATANVAFVTRHQDEIAGVLQDLGVEGASIAK
jgi:hypothetical protein